jgi:hypothetical protein
MQSAIALSENAEYKAARLSFFGIWRYQSFGLGPQAIPPPVHIGEVLEPARARPVPFWRQGFLPPPDTPVRVFVDELPAVVI